MPSRQESLSQMITAAPPSTVETRYRILAQSRLVWTDIESTTGRETQIKLESIFLLPMVARNSV